MATRPPASSYALKSAEKRETARAELDAFTPDHLAEITQAKKNPPRAKPPPLPVSRLTGGQRGTIVPHGRFFYVKFRSLPDPNGKTKQLKRRVGLIEDMNIEQARDTALGIIEREAPRLPVAGEACSWPGWCARYLNVYVLNVQSTGSERNVKSIITKHLLPAFHDMQLHEITNGRVATLVAQWSRAGAASGTIEGRYHLLRRMLKAAESEGWRIAPIGHIKLPRNHAVRERRDSLTFATPEVLRIIEAAGPMLRLLCSFFAFMALRTGEALGIRWSDIDLDAGRLYLVRQYRHGREAAPKTRSSAADRRIPEGVLALLRPYREARPGAHVYVFQSDRTARPFDDSGLRKHHFRPVLRQLGIAEGNGRSFHAFRRWFATEAWLSGQTMAQMQQALRHADPRSTIEYFHVQRSEGEAAQDAVSSRYQDFRNGLVQGQVHDPEKRNDQTAAYSTVDQGLAGEQHAAHVPGDHHPVLKRCSDGAHARDDDIGQDRAGD